MTLSTSLENYTVWFVTGSQGLYGEETLRPVSYTHLTLPTICCV